MAFYTEMCCRAGGSNLNAGSTNGGSVEPSTSPDFEYISGSWDSTNGEFTVASGNPQTDGVQIGDFASVYPDGSTTTSFIGRVITVTSTKITVSITICMGTIPTTGSSNTTLRIGGAWLGPDGGVGFPFSLLSPNLFNTSDHLMRINFKNDRTYSITSATTWGDGTSGPTRAFVCTFEGYNTTYGDGGMAKIEGASSGGSYRMLYIQRGKQVLRNLWFDKNGSTGSSNLVRIESVTDSLGGLIEGCKFTNARGSGLEVRSVGCKIVNCIASDNNKSSTIYQAGFIIFVNCTMVRCVAKNNLLNGFTHGASASTNYFECIAIGSSTGFSLDNTGGYRGCFINCISYNNGNGFNVDSAECVVMMENCIAYRTTIGGTGFVFGVPGTVTTRGFYQLNNCAVGNHSARFTAAADIYTNDQNPINLTENPFIDAANGDFRLNDNPGGGALLKGKSNHRWRELAEGATKTIAYADVGAVQSDKYASEYKFYRKKKR